MNTQTTSMSFFKNPSLQVHNIRNTNSITTPHDTILINLKVTTFTLINQCKSIDQTQIRFLSFSNLIQNTTSKLQHTKLHTTRSFFTYQTQVSKLFQQVKLSNHQHRYVQRLPTQGISYNIRLTRMVVQTKIIVLQELQPSPLPHIQLFLIKQILQALVITKHIKSRSKQIMPPKLQNK